MRLNATTLLLILVAGFGPLEAAAQRPGRASSLNPALWREDLQYFARELPKRHKNPFHTVSREQFERAVAELDREIPSLRDHQVVVRMLQITASVGDAHTYVHLPQTFLRYPVVLYWFGNDLRVIRGPADLRKILGARVVKVGDLALADVQARLLTVLSQGENEGFVLHNGPGYLVHPEILHTLGVVPDLGPAAWTLEDDQGTRFTVSLTTVPADTRLELLSAAKSEPLSRQKPNESFWFTYLPESRTVYVSFRGYESLGDNARKLFRFLDANPTEKLVIDMRQNGGGDFTKVRRSLLPGIRQRPRINRKGHLFVVTGRRTFSAAMVNAIDFRKETNAILAGEPPGERPNGYQENDEMTLPNSRVVVSYSTRYYKFLEEDVPEVSPDRRIDPNWAYYADGRDPVMEWILAAPP